LITTRILVQFVGQIAVLIRLRRAEPERARPFRMWLYPVPALVALAGWIFVFATSGTQVIGFGLATLAAGVVAYLLWRRRSPVAEIAA
jgi:amino acid transporter